MATKKEKCFRKAVDKLNEGRKAKGQQPMDVKHEQGWIRDLDGSWTEASWYRELWYSIRKTIRIDRRIQLALPANPTPFSTANRT